MGLWALNGKFVPKEWEKNMRKVIDSGCILTCECTDLTWMLLTLLFQVFSHRGLLDQGLSQIATRNWKSNGVICVCTFVEKHFAFHSGTGAGFDLWASSA